MVNKYSISIKPRFRDLDGLGHVNNAVYLTYLEIARTEWFMDIFPDLLSSDFSFIIAKVEINYKSPITLKSFVRVDMIVSRIGNKSWDFTYKIVDEKTDIIYADAKTVQVIFDYKLGKSMEISELYLKLLRELQFTE